MARSELIKELRIRREEIYAELKENNPNLVIQLEAIDSMIDVSIGNSTHATTSSDNVLKGTPKGKMPWADYIYLILKEIGGSGKTNDVAEAVVRANKNMEFKKAKNACGDKLSKL